VKPALGDVHFVAILQSKHQNYLIKATLFD